MKKCLGLCLILALLWSVAAAEAPANSPERFALTADTAVHLDLNGDGTEESVLWHCEKVGEYEDESVELTVTSASGDAVTWKSDLLYFGRVYATDLDADGQIELFITGDEMSADYITHCLRYDGATLTPIPFPDVSRNDENSGMTDAGYGEVTAIDGNTITLTGSQDVLGTYFASRTFALQDDAFQFADDGLWHVRNDGLSEEDLWAYRALTPLKNIPATWIADGVETPGEIPAGEKFTITAFDKLNTAYFVTQDGREGRLDVARDTAQGWGWTVNGIPESELFESVPYAD